MIQRIQTIYTLAVIGLLTSLFFTPIATAQLTESSEMVKIQPFLTGSQPQLDLSEVSLIGYITILIVIAALVAIAALLSYKKRLLQIRLSLANMALLTGLQIFVGFSLYKSGNYIEFMNNTIANYSPGLSYSVVAIFPSLAIILSFLAFRGVMKDEMLVRSLDRIR